jgi:two-component system, OmpR family, sensor histidine kinase CiaH
MTYFYIAMARYHNILFVIVLSYTILALGFWYNSLQKQNTIMYNKEMQIFNLTKDTLANASDRLASIEDKKRRKHTQYVGEGVTFLAMIIVGAVLVLRSFRKRLQLTQQQNNFMMSITHELKTPIAGIKLVLETLGRRKIQPEQQDKLISNGIGDTERLNELCNNILLSTQLEGRQYSKHFQAFNLNELLSKTVEDFANRYTDKKWVANIYTSANNYNGDSFLWKMAINNLLENAQKYAKHSRQIIVDAYDSDDSIVVQVIDEGIGISDADKKKIFQKFYRSGDENTRNSKGTGLGLYIVKQAIELHGGVVSMADNKPKGNIAIIQIPKAL